MYHNTKVYLNEIALHDFASPEDFKPPYSLERHCHDKRSNANPMEHLNAVVSCITSAQMVIETFLCMDVELLRTLPMVNYIRIIYAIFILDMLATNKADAPVEYCNLFDQGSLQIDTYSILVVRHLERVVGPAHCKIPSIILRKMLRLQGWRRLHKFERSASVSKETAAPAKLKQAMSSLNMAQPPKDTAIHAIGIPNGQYIPPGGNKALGLASASSSQQIFPNSMKITMPGSLRLANPLQDSASHASQAAAYPEGPINQCDIGAGHETALDLSGDCHMDLDPDTLFLFSEMENIASDNIDWAWQVDSDVASGNLQEQQNENMCG